MLIGKLVDLHAWGRPAPGEWWALVSWSIYGVLEDGTNGHIWCSAWVPAGEVRRSSYPTEQPLYRYLERLDLPTDRAAWPTPARREGQQWHHFGPVDTCPAGTPGMKDAVGGHPWQR